LTINLFAVKGEIRVELQSHKNLYTSQKIIVAIELLTDAFSISNARITFPSSLEYIVNAPKSAAYISTEEINGTDWQMVHYEYEVYTLKAGEIEIPPVSATFSASMGYGQPKKEFALQSKALQFDVKTPEGIKKDQFVLVTEHFALEHALRPEKKQLIVGDAVELQVTQKASGVPDILFQPVVYQSNALLRVYDKEPILKSKLSGTYDVSRTDKFTFVANMEGNVTVPEQKVFWWNSKSKKVQVEKLPEISFEIIADPQIALDAKNVQQKKFLLYAISILLVLLVLYRFLAPSLRNYISKRKKMYILSEKGKFEDLNNSMQQSDASVIYQKLYVWLESITPELSRGGFEAIIALEPSLQEHLNALEEKVIDDTQPLDTVCFSKELAKLREKLLVKKIRVVYGLPKTINPS
jgi:hypothetical protein